MFRNFTNPGAGWTATVDTLDTTAPQAGARLGCALDGGNVGDANTVDDMIAGAPNYGANAKGRVFIFFGQLVNPPLPTPDTLDSGQPSMTGEHFGSSVVYIPKILPTCLGAVPCVAGGAPEANPSGLANGGLVTVYQYQP